MTAWAHLCEEGVNNTFSNQFVISGLQEDSIMDLKTSLKLLQLFRGVKRRRNLLWTVWVHFSFKTFTQRQNWDKNIIVQSFFLYILTLWNDSLFHWHNYEHDVTSFWVWVPQTWFLTWRHFIKKVFCHTFYIALLLTETREKLHHWSSNNYI